MTMLMAGGKWVHLWQLMRDKEYRGSCVVGCWNIGENGNWAKRMKARTGTLFSVLQVEHINSLYG
jgi:hypothetical protein